MNRVSMSLPWPWMESLGILTMVSCTPSTGSLRMISLGTPTSKGGPSLSLAGTLGGLEGDRLLFLFLSGVFFFCLCRLMDFFPLPLPLLALVGTSSLNSSKYLDWKSSELLM